MSALKLFDQGYTDLVSVIPPGAELSPNSAVDPDTRGKVPGRKGKHGWYGYNFITAEPPTREDVQTWEGWKANVGLLGKNFPALDIDSEDRLITQVVEKFARDRLGMAPVRLSTGDRRLMVYRTEAPFSRMALIITRAGKSHLVEMLGDGRQYLVHGKHPSGEEYRWQNRPLWKVPVAELPVVDREKVSAFFDALAAALKAKGVEVERVGDGAAAAEKNTPPAEDLKAPSIEALQDLPIPPNPETYGWDEYVKFGYAYAAAGAEDPGVAYDLWVAWSAQHPKHDIEQCERQWAKGFKDARVGWSWLQEQAEATGEYSSASDDFEADPAMAGQHLEAPAAPAPKEKRVRFSDEDFVARVLPALRPKICFVPGRGGDGRWYVWGGHKWQQDDLREHELIVRAEAKTLALRYQDIAEQAPTKAEGKEYQKAAQRLQSDAGISAILRLIRAHLAVGETGFDTDPMLLNTATGVVDLRTGEVTAPDPAGRHSRSTPVGPESREAPLFDRFLHDLTAGDEEFVDWLQKWVGYCLTGDVTEKVLGYAWGGTDTGKSQFIRILNLLLGDYADSIDVETFISSRKGGSKGDAELARLTGARLVTATEPEEGTAWDEQRIKAITGGDPISARFLYGNPFSYYPRFKILIAGNGMPEIRHVHEAMLRRILVLPFNRHVPRERQVEKLAERLIEREGPAILDWAIRGCLRWQAEGLTPPAVVQAKCAEYAADQDTLAQFIDEQCQVGKEFSIAREDLFQAWASWCRQRHESAGKALSFRGLFAPYAQRLGCEETFVTTTTDQRKRGYKGIALLPRVEHGTEEFAA